MTIAESFKRFRARYNLSKTDVAKTLNIKLPGYKYESEGKDKGRAPNAETLIKLAKAYHVSVDYLLGLTDEPRPNVSPIIEVQNITPPTTDERVKNLETEVAELKAQVAKLTG